MYIIAIADRQRRPALTTAKRTVGKVASDAAFLRSLKNAMAFVSLPNGVKVAMEYTLNGELIVNIYYVTTINPIITANLTQIAEVFRDWFADDLDSNFTSQLLLQRVVATDWTMPSGLQTTLTVSPPLPGLNAPPTAPNNVALVVGHLTGFSGRSFRGRTYHAGLQGSDVTDNFISAPRALDVLAAYDQLELDLAAIGATRVVASFVANGAPRAVGVATPITTTRLDSRVDTQRRRLPDTGA